jgi:hypothetical protein
MVAKRKQQEGKGKKRVAEWLFWQRINRGSAGRMELVYGNQPAAKRSRCHASIKPIASKTP